jgi:inhibitor of cysteine peptidase
MPLLTITEMDSGKTFRAAPGACIRICLRENPTTGYRWSLRPFATAVLALKSDDYLLASGPELGCGGIRQFELIAQAPGICGIGFQNRREWEGDTSDQPEVSLTFIVE